MTNERTTCRQMELSILINCRSAFYCSADIGTDNKNRYVETKSCRHFLFHLSHLATLANFA